VSTFKGRRDLRNNRTSVPQKNQSKRADVQRGSRWDNPLIAGAILVAASLFLVALVTAGLFAIRDSVPLNLIPLIYILPVIFSATRWGIVPGLVAAVTSAAAADFFFYPPFYSLWLQNGQDVIDLLLYLLVAIVTSNLAARLRNEVDTSVRREKEISELHVFSQGLATCLTSRDLIFAVQDYLSNTLKYRAVLIASAPDDSESGKGDDAVPDRIRREAIKLIAAQTLDSSILMETLPRRAWLVRIIAPEILGYGAIAIELGDVTRDGLEATVKRVEAVLREAMVTLKHLKTKEAIEQATLNYRTEVLRDALVGGMSHELRSPLASILGSCSVLHQLPAIVNDDRSHALIEAIHDQAAKLDAEIRDLLDASRISANGVHPQFMWTDPTDIIAGAVKQKERRLSDHSVVFDLQKDPPFVHVDPVLVEQALGQLLENAAKYSSAGGEIKITSRFGRGYFDLSVTDHGVGLTAEEQKELGKRCYRNDRHAAVPGSGLGLWIASTFAAANGGSIFAESAGPRLGATVSLRLPLVSEEIPEFVDAPDA
jgi:K+-sensing histidine kinase KdpD